MKTASIIPTMTLSKDADIAIRAAAINALSRFGKDIIEISDIEHGIAFARSNPDIATMNGKALSEQDRIIRCIETRNGKATRRELVRSLKNSIPTSSLDGILEKMRQEGILVRTEISNYRGRPTVEYRFA